MAFDSWRRVGSVMQAIKVYNLREVDEIVFLDIAATAEKRTPDFELVDEIADECFMPLTVGGGVKTPEDVERLLQVGADKVAVNTAALETPDLVTQIAAKFGSQCVVVSIDCKRNGENRWGVYSHSGACAANRSAVEFARAVAEKGAGEILLTSIERDGTMVGYDLELIRAVSEAVTIPVIASGGAGNYAHLLEAVQHGASAVAAASIFHFTQQTPLDAKRFLHEHGVRVRL
ncbi:MAG: imidazole glycerol phosphate synthase subunit HisF [Candidatus Acidiferrales bacterium]